MFNRFFILIILLFIPITYSKAEESLIVDTPLRGLSTTESPEVSPQSSPEITEEILLPSPQPSPSPSISPKISPSPKSTPIALPTFPPREGIIPEFPEAPIPSPPAIPSPPPLPEFPKMPETPKITKPQIKKPYKKIDFSKLPLPDFAE